MNLKVFISFKNKYTTHYTKYLLISLLSLIFFSLLVYAFYLAIYGKHAGIDMQYFPSLQFYGKVAEHLVSLEKELSSSPLSSQHSNENWLYLNVPNQSTIFSNFSINPYEAYLNGMNNFKANSPNYAHIFYVILYPLTILNFTQAKIAFAIFNILCLFMTIFYLIRLKVPTIIISIFFILGTLGFPINTIMQSGQFGIILSLLIVMSIYHRQNVFLLSFLLSLCLIKYSFGVFILIAFFALGYFKASIFSLILSFLYSLIFIFKFEMYNRITTSGIMYVIDYIKLIIYNLTLPLKVNHVELKNGPSDMMSVFNNIISSNGLQNHYYYIALFFSLIVFIFLCLKIIKRNKINISENTFFISKIIGLFILFSLFSVYHLGYDWYLIIIVFCLFFIEKDVNLKNLITEIIQNKGLLVLFCLTLFLFMSARILRLFGLNLPFVWGYTSPFLLTLSTCLLFLLSIILLINYEFNISKDRKLSTSNL